MRGEGHVADGVGLRVVDHREDKVGDFPPGIGERGVDASGRSGFVCGGEGMVGGDALD